jgi:hypothetical protein
MRMPRSLGFLSVVGAALEIDNLVYAQAISRQTPGATFDHALVRAEQARLQRYVRAHQTQRPQQWELIHNELNGLLNDRCAGSFLSRWHKGSGRLCRVLREVREQVRRELDFADETHRIRIGLGLIEQIRLERAG